MLGEKQNKYLPSDLQKEIQIWLLSTNQNIHYYQLDIKYYVKLFKHSSRDVFFLRKKKLNMNKLVSTIIIQNIDKILETSEIYEVWGDCALQASL